MRGSVSSPALLSKAVQMVLDAAVQQPAEQPAPRDQRRGVKRARIHTSEGPSSPSAMWGDRTDPITLEPLASARRVFSYSRGRDSTGAFDLHALVEYLVATGDFRDPETRVPFSDETLQALDAMAAEEGLTLPSAAKRSRGDEYSASKSRLVAVTGVERLAHEHIAECLAELEREPFSASTAQVCAAMLSTCARPAHQATHLLTTQRVFQVDIFPQLANVLQQMASLDRGAWVA